MAGLIMRHKVCKMSKIIHRKEQSEDSDSDLKKMHSWPNNETQSVQDDSNERTI